MKYRTIVADPPWDHSDGTGVHVDTGAITSVPYLTMTVDEIKALPVKALSDNVDADTHLYLWTTSRYLRDAFDVARSWGFHYTATLVWCKQSRGFSVGGVYQNNVEFVLFCRRPKVTTRRDALAVTSYLADAAERSGVSRRALDLAMGTSDMAGWWLSRIETRCACPSPEQYERIKSVVGAGDEMDEAVRLLNAAKGQTTNHTPQGSTTRWFTWPRGAHSAKPEAFIDMVEQVSPPPYVELFARRHRLGWDVWGNESANTAQMVAAP
jgi:N6-adenosine-specific RNA methylase IME4